MREFVTYNKTTMATDDMAAMRLFLIENFNEKGEYFLPELKTMILGKGAVTEMKV